MRYYSEEQTKNLRRAFEEAVLEWSKVSTEKMFGCPCYKVGNKLFAFFVTRGIVITQLTQTDRVKLSTRHRATVFHAGKRRIQNWVRVPITDGRDLARIMPYVRRSYESVRAKTKSIQG